LGGHVTAASGSSAFIPHVKAGKLRLLITYGDNRMATFPNVRTLKECGYEISYPSHVGIAGPKDLPAGVVRVLENAFKEGMKEDVFKSTMERLSMPISFLDSANYQRYLQKVDVRAAELIEALGLGKK
jgi:tripartite-type tricarboxylate transporter receptor subunit TctC